MRDVLRLGGDDRAPRAVAEVVLDLAVIATPEIAAGIRAEPLDRPLAVRAVGDRAQVRLDPCLAQPLPGAEGELSDGRRLHAEQRRDLRRLHLLDLGVPEHFLPALRQRAERLRGEAAIERVVGRVRVGIRIRHELEFVDRTFALRASPAGGRVADAREEIGAERPGRSAAPHDRLIDPRVRLLDEVVSVEGRGDRPRHDDAGAVVASPQFAEGRAVARTRAQHEVRVGDVSDILTRSSVFVHARPVVGFTHETRVRRNHDAVLAILPGARPHAPCERGSTGPHTRRKFLGEVAS